MTSGRREQHRRQETITDALFMICFSSRIIYLLLTVILSVLAGCSGIIVPSAEQSFGDRVIAHDETWSGTVRIKGIVTVKKGAQLVIRPGTRVLFERIDRDGDGIGDSELLVEGAIIARGTVDAPIVLTSAAENRQPADWKYLYLDFARLAEIDYMISEYAYSGIQVHFCKALIENSIFRHNIDGVRFSTVNIVVKGNRIYRNKNGLRYEERGSTAEVTGNDIRDNEIGVFIVTRSEDKAKIVRNNIVANRRYNVKLGISQATDVTLPQNWWGEVVIDRIEQKFFDAKQDESLGRVRAPEPLSAPVELTAAGRE